MLTKGWANRTANASPVSARAVLAANDSGKRIGSCAPARTWPQRPRMPPQSVAATSSESLPRRNAFGTSLALSPEHPSCRVS